MTDVSIETWKSRSAVPGGSCSSDSFQCRLGASVREFESYDARARPAVTRLNASEDEEFTLEISEQHSPGKQVGQCQVDMPPDRKVAIISVVTLDNAPHCV
ncbi:hypothetical protein chiPu_0020093 [Chiloscyllium punctatum]|uniref:Uncharacterized protein n=1 Tax=Chiloscyllium punctatum TaxID=137246 RepID=A0A401RTY4_CHIPU|nr:hypothetical protein [Chiloscyllium punctatum]